MDKYKYLIWQYSTNNDSWFDATEDVEWVKDNGKSYFIKYKNKPYPINVSYLHLQYYAYPEEIDFLIIEYKGRPLFKIKLCLLFLNKYKIFYENGCILVANENDIVIHKDELKNNPYSQGVMNYYKNVVQLTAKTEEDSFLLSQFASINNINENSVLALYLRGLNGKSSCPLNKAIISPFGCNLSQFNAIKKAFNNRISIIEGPPGTGKTQTILNLIANAITKGYKVAVVSNNNSTIENIYEKLDKYGFSFLCALLGNKENIDTFFDHIDIKVPDLKTGVRTQSERIGQFSYLLPDLFNKENTKNILIEKKKSIELEYKHFLLEHKEFDFEKYIFKTNKISKNKLLHVLVFLSEYQNKPLSKFKKFKLRRMIKANKSFNNLSLEDQIILLQNQYFLVSIKEAENEIDTINEVLSNLSFSELLDEYKKLSMISFKNSLNELFKDKRNNLYERKDYKKNFEQFVQDFPVVLSSTYALAKCTQDGYLFDYLIVDESSQVNMASSILSMRVAKNIVIVGDTKQLPQIDDECFKETNNDLLKKFGVDESYSYYGNSIMSSFLKVYKDSIPRTLLREHYRCKPEIIGFCNQEFYDNQLIICTNNNNNIKSLRLIKLVEGNHARKNPEGEGLYSEREADEILNLINKEHPLDVGIIAPYRIQVETIKQKLKDFHVDISTIHKFQGREKKNIILSTVVNDSNEFVDDPNMINVAVSRAIDTFTLVTSDKIVKGERGVLSDLVNYIKYHTEFSIVEEGTIRSVFDILYSDYTKELETFRKKHPSKDYDTENIIKNLILDIISNNEFKHLRMSMHVSLKDIFVGQSIEMNEKELKFFLNPWTHADFVIYNKFSNKPFAIIEVDGVSFHEQQQKQVERDLLKDSIIKKFRIKFIRLRTNESDERERIISLLS